MPDRSFFAENSSRRSVSLSKPSDLVLKFLVSGEAVAHLAHSRRRRNVAPSREARESMTCHPDHRILATHKTQLIVVAHL